MNIPESHLEYLTGAYYAVLTTLMPDGQPQSSVVWADYDDTYGDYLLINTSLERQKTRNMQRDPRVVLIVLDPNDTNCFIEIRGTVTDITQDDAVPHADKLARLYSGKSHFYGGVYPAEKRSQETRVLIKIAINKVTTNAIFS